MVYLNHDCLNGLCHATFHKRRPYPWADIQGTLTQQGFARLRESLPDVSLFDRSVGYRSQFGRKFHDRYILHWQEGVKVSEPWWEFVDELLHGPVYLPFLRRMLGLDPGKRIILTMDWFYAWKGCSVSPHCDALRKVATHIFYFNNAEDWKDEWGGHVLIEDDEGRRNRRSAPDFDDLKVAATVAPWGNGSLLFQRTDHSWHGVRPLDCPEGYLRKLFLVTVNVPTIQVLWRRLRGKDPDGYPLKARAA